MSHLSTDLTGGPAFPYAFQHEDASHFTSSGFAPGMTLRDWFAGQALIGVLSNHDLLLRIDEEFGVNVPTREAAARWALALADAMLEARKRTTPSGLPSP